MIYKHPRLWLTGFYGDSRGLADMTMTTRAEQQAQEFLLRHGITQPPTPVADLAEAEGIVVVHEPFRDDEVSGVLMREPHRTTIIVNAANAPVRQRFTIAHEIGHYLMHDGEMYLDGRARVNFREGLSSMATNQEEIDANAFAAALLMAADWVRSAFESVVRSTPIGSEDELAEILASSFNVSRQAMLYRLIHLGLVSAP